MWVGERRTFISMFVLISSFFQSFMQQNCHLPNTLSTLGYNNACVCVCVYAEISDYKLKHT